jgi:hypothetical protein
MGYKENLGCIVKAPFSEEAVRRILINGERLGVRYCEVNLIREPRFFTVEDVAGRILPEPVDVIFTPEAWGTLTISRRLINNAFTVRFILQGKYGNIVYPGEEEGGYVHYEWYLRFLLSLVEPYEIIALTAGGEEWEGPSGQRPYRWAARMFLSELGLIPYAHRGIFRRKRTISKSEFQEGLELIDGVMANAEASGCVFEPRALSPEDFLKQPLVFKCSSPLGELLVKFKSGRCSDCSYVSVEPLDRECASKSLRDYSLLLLDLSKGFKIGVFQADSGEFGLLGHISSFYLRAQEYFFPCHR